MKTPVGTTFVVAASLLGVAAVVQLVAILIYFGPGFYRGPSGNGLGGTTANFRGRRARSEPRSARRDARDGCTESAP